MFLLIWPRHFMSLILRNDHITWYSLCILRANSSLVDDVVISIISRQMSNHSLKTLSFVSSSSSKWSLQRGRVSQYKPHSRSVVVTIHDSHYYSLTTHKRCHHKIISRTSHSLINAHFILKLPFAKATSRVLLFSSPLTPLHHHVVG